jgi:putative intracellular protease/amidase
MKRTLVRLMGLGMTVVLLGCGGGDDGTGPPSDNENNDNNPSAREILANPEFGANIQEIFNRRGCSSASCHGAALSANMDLRAGAAFASLVNVVAFSDAAFSRVTPNDAQNSYLVMKVEGRQTAGGRMPLGGANLDNIDLTNIRNWIDTGAPNN